MTQPNSCRYVVVDVFSTEALAGNPLAVFPDAAEIDETDHAEDRQRTQSGGNHIRASGNAQGLRRARAHIHARKGNGICRPSHRWQWVCACCKKKSSREIAVISFWKSRSAPVPLRVETGRRPLIWLRMPPVREEKFYDSSLCARALGLEPQDLLPIKPTTTQRGKSHSSGCRER